MEALGGLLGLVILGLNIWGLIRIGLEWDHPVLTPIGGFIAISLIGFLISCIKIDALVITLWVILFLIIPIITLISVIREDVVLPYKERKEWREQAKQRENQENKGKALLDAEKNSDSQNAAISELRRKADAGDAEAQYELGIYYKNKGSTWNAADWLAKATEQGHREAYEELLKVKRILSDERDRLASNIPEAYNPLIERITDFYRNLYK